METRLLSKQPRRMVTARLLRVGFLIRLVGGAVDLDPLRLYLSAARILIQ